MKEQIIDEIHLLEESTKAARKKYGYEDIRVSFFDGLHSVLCHYLLHIEIPENDFFQNIYSEIFKVKTFKDGDLVTQKQNILNSANSTLIIDAWSNFELFISYLSNSCFSKELKTEMLNKNYDEMIKCLNKVDVDGSKIRCIEKMKLLNFHLVQSNMKISKTLSFIKNKYESRTQLKDHRDFLLNFGRLRNCIHSNYIFHGKEEIEYQFGDITMKYVPNEPIIVDPNEFDFIFGLVRELRSIGEFIIDSIDYPDVIYDPSHLLVE